MYALDMNAARKAEETSRFLKETGKYTGHFTRAEKLVSAQKNTHGVGFTFETTDGRSTRFDIWTMKADGEKLSGYDAVNAIMVCLKLRALTEAQATVDKYDWTSKQNIKAQVTVWKELMNAPIGLVLRSTEYEKMQDGRKTGETAWRLELVCPFEAATEFTAGEILDKKTQPTKLASIIATLSDKPLSSRPAQAQRAQPASRPAPAYDQQFEDDQIPF